MIPLAAPKCTQANKQSLTDQVASRHVQVVRLVCLSAALGRVILRRACPSGKPYQQSQQAVAVKSLQNKIRGAKSIQELVLIATGQPQGNGITTLGQSVLPTSELIQILHRCVKILGSDISTSSTWYAVPGRSSQIRHLLDLVAVKLTLEKSLSPKVVATGIWALARLGGSSHDPHLPRLISAARSISLHMLKPLHDFAPQGLAMVAWSLGHARWWPDPSQLWVCLSNEALRRKLEGFVPQDLQQFACSSALLALQSCTTMTLMTEVSSRAAHLVCRGSFKPQELSNLVWGFVKLLLPGTQITGLLEAISTHRIEVNIGRHKSFQTLLGHLLL